MKKKLLSLVLAGAMVASTSVSAFADTVVDKHEGTANVTITGSVDANNGNSPTGTISVSVPTALSFSVNKDGEVSGGNITIANNGVDTVDVTAVKFYDKTPTSKITAKIPTEFTAADEERSNMVLSIGGNQSERAYFKSETLADNKNGIYSVAGDNKLDGIKISSITGGNTDVLDLDGFAGEEDLTNDSENAGVTDSFVLTLKITKANK